MKCDRCGEQIPAGEETEHYCQILCEECYMQTLSPSRACDPWAVRSAQVLSQMQETRVALRPIQSLILQVLREKGGLEPNALAEKLGMKLPELERELTTLRHMERIRGKRHAGKTLIILWDS